MSSAKKVVNPTKTTVSEFGYDAQQNRYKKDNYSILTNRFAHTITQTHDVSYYIRDAQGNVLAIYNKQHNAYYNTETGENSQQTYHLNQKEQHLYGSSRLGIVQLDRQMSMMSWSGADLITQNQGIRNYELTNHLGNVLSTITDKGVITSAQDYYPFGLTLASRSFTEGGSVYRFSFNGKEDDKDLKSQDYGARMYRKDLGIWSSIDPKTHKLPSFSPYVFCLNKPIILMDPDGKYPIITITNEVTGYTYMHVYGKTSATMIQPTYKLILSDVKIHKDGTKTTTELATYNVTRDGWYNLGPKNGVDGELKFENRAFEPQKDGITYTAVLFDYKDAGNTPALALRQNGSSKLDATPLTSHTYTDGTPLKADVDRKEEGVASGVMIHIGGWYDNLVTVKLAGAYGCMGVVSDKNVFSVKIDGNIDELASKNAARVAHKAELDKQNLSNDTMEDFRVKMQNSLNQEQNPANKKIEVTVKKYRINNGSLTILVEHRLKQVKF